MADQMKHNPEADETYRIELIDEAGRTGPKCERRDITRIYRAMCAQYPDRAITLCDGAGRVLEKASPTISAKPRDSACQIGEGRGAPPAFSQEMPAVLEFSARKIN